MFDCFLLVYFWESEFRLLYNTAMTVPQNGESAEKSSKIDRQLFRIYWLLPDLSVQSSGKGRCIEMGLWVLVMVGKVGFNTIIQTPSIIFYFSYRMSHTSKNESSASYRDGILVVVVAAGVSFLKRSGHSRLLCIFLIGCRISLKQDVSRIEMGFWLLVMTREWESRLMWVRWPLGLGCFLTFRVID